MEIDFQRLLGDVSVIIDWETTSSRSIYCRPISLGVVAIDWKRGGKEYHLYIEGKIDDIFPVIDDEETIKWLESHFLGEWYKSLPWVHLDHYVNKITSFSLRYIQGRDVTLWGNGPTFDCLILNQRVMAGTAWPTPFGKYWDERCLRTTTNMMDRALIPKFEGTKHHALDDAIHEAATLKAWVRDGKREES